MTTEPPAGLTPSQTVGPFFHDALTPKAQGRPARFGANLQTPDAVGERITLTGRVLDGDGVPVPDAMVEIWQADGAGRFAGTPGANTAFPSFGRAPTDAEGRFTFHTVKPGPIPGPAGTVQAPHLAVSLFARGVLVRLHTRIYLAGEAANAADPILQRVPPARRGTLIAQLTGPAHYAHDIRLQGEGETVFFSV